MSKEVWLLLKDLNEGDEFHTLSGGTFFVGSHRGVFTDIYSLVNMTAKQVEKVWKVVPNRHLVLAGAHSGAREYTAPTVPMAQAEQEVSTE